MPAKYMTDGWRAERTEEGKAAGLKGDFFAGTSRKYPPGGRMSTYISKPEGWEPNKNSAAVIIVHHGLGIFNQNFLRSFADRLAGAGYLALLPDFYHRVWDDEILPGNGISEDKMDIPKMFGSLKDSQILDDVETALGMTASAGEIGSLGFGWGAASGSAPTAVLGFCLGGRAAWLAAVHQNFKGRILAAVPYHGGGVFRGTPQGGEEGSGPGDRMEELHCPVLGHFAELDKNPSQEDAAKLLGLAEKHGKQLECLSYPNCNHGFSCMDSVNYAEEQAVRAWGPTLDFLAKTLGPGIGSTSRQHPYGPKGASNGAAQGVGGASDPELAPSKL